VTPDGRRAVAQHLQAHWALSQRRACRLSGIARSVYRYQKQPDPNGPLRETLRQLAQQHLRSGAPMLYRLLRARGWVVNHKRIERLYRAERLTLPRCRPRRAPLVRGVPARAVLPNECWAMDFIHDALATKRVLRCLTVIDEVTRVSPLIAVGHSLPSEGVIEALEPVIQRVGCPQRLRVDNGPEFRSRVFLTWAAQHRIQVDFIAPGKPTQNAFIESFNGRLRQECLNPHWFLSVDDARDKIEAWRQFYNTQRPHSALRCPPQVFAQRKQDELLLTRT
jgi:putative transposase